MTLANCVTMQYRNSAKKTNGYKFISKGTKSKKVDILGIYGKASPSPIMTKVIIKTGQDAKEVINGIFGVRII